MDPFADADDVAARWRPLTSDEQVVAQTLCGDASNVIRARFPGIDSQVTTGAVTADVLTQVAAEMVKAALVAPEDGVASESDTVGPYSRSQTFANPLRKVFITDAQVLLIIGYQPRASSHTFGNTTRHCENSGPGFIYGPGL